jgi:hypothetical protein
VETLVKRTGAAKSGLVLVHVTGCPWEELFSYKDFSVLTHEMGRMWIFNDMCVWLGTPGI